MSKARLALFKPALLLCIIGVIAGGAQSAFAQAAAKPAPIPNPATAGIDARAVNEAVDSSLSDDPPVDKMLEAYSPKVRALDTVIGKLKGDLKKGGTGAGSLGNFVTDGIRVQAC